MKRQIISSLLPVMLLCLGSYQGAFAHFTDAPDHELVTISTEDYRSTMRTLALLDVDVAGVDIQQGLIDIYVSAEELAMLESAIPKVAFQKSAVDLQRRPDPKYYNSARVVDRLNELAGEYPDLVTLEQIGSSLNGKAIWAVRVTNSEFDDGFPKPAVLYNSMHHSREVMTTEVAIDTVEYLLENYADDALVRRWVDTTEIWVVPMLNVDGNDIVWTKDPMWRKNARGGYGVDLNRNYPFNWNACNGSSGSAWSQTYRGASPASEPETQALMQLVASIRPVFNISYHSYSEMVLYPLGCRNQRTTNRDVVEGIGRQIAAALPSDTNPNRHYSVGTPWELLYSVDGGDVDWMYGVYGTIPYVIELSSQREGFQPSYDRWRDATVIKSRAAWQLLLERLHGSGIRGVVNMTPGRSPGEVSVRLENLDQPHVATEQHNIQADGSFHLVLLPGTYMLTLTDGSFTAAPVTVTVAHERVDLHLDF